MRRRLPRQAWKASVIYTLRHSAAVAWLEAGVAVADLLGHSSIAVTGDIYGHTSMTPRGRRSTGSSGRSACESSHRRQMFVRRERDGGTE